MACYFRICPCLQESVKIISYASTPVVASGIAR